MINQIIQGDCFEILPKIKSKTIDLILTDPPYLISRNSNFQNSDNTKFNSISIDFGQWDKEDFDIEKLLIEYYRVLRPGGTLVIFYDVWKSNQIKFFAEKAGFKQPRVCQWIKTNPVPVNSKLNYLSNASEFFFTFVKSKKPTFNSEYDKGVYQYPLCHGKERTKHPTQKPLPLIKDLISKHSNEGDLVLDTFGGSGTTAVACKLLNRDYILVEMDQDYVDIANLRLI